MELQLEQKQISCLIPSAHRTVEERISVDFVVPDSLPDAAELLLTEGALCLWRLDLSDGSAELEGELSAQICCADEHGAPMSFPAHVPVQLRLRAEAIETGQKPFLKCHMKSLNGQLLNSRKVRVQGILSCSLLTYCASEYSITTGIDSADQRLFLRKTVLPVTYVSSAEEQVYSVEETLPLRLGVPAGGRLMSWCSVPVLDDCDCMEQRVILKGRVRTSLLYQDAESQKLVDETVETPFSFLMDVNGAVSKCAVSLHFTREEVRCRNDDLAVDTAYHLLAQVICFAQQELECVTDAYSNRNQLDLKWIEVKLPVLIQQEREQTFLEENLSCDLTGKTISALRSFCNGDTISVTALLADEDRKISSTSVILNTKQSPDDAVWSEQPEATLSNNGVTVRLPVFSKREAIDENSIRVLTSADLKDEKINRSSGVTLLRRDDEMDLWELARSYGSSVEAICAANPDSDRQGKWIVVPHVL